MNTECSYIIILTLVNMLCMNEIEEIKSRLNTSNAWYRLVQNLLPFCLLYININIELCKTIILPVVLYACEMWSDIKGRTYTEDI
jgi:hypothetical protein